MGSPKYTYKDFNTLNGKSRAKDLKGAPSFAISLSGLFLTIIISLCIVIICFSIVSLHYHSEIGSSSYNVSRVLFKMQLESDFSITKEVPECLKDSNIHSEQIVPDGFIDSLSDDMAYAFLYGSRDINYDKTGLATSVQTWTDRIVSYYCDRYLADSLSYGIPENNTDNSECLSYIMETTGFDISKAIGSLPADTKDAKSVLLTQAKEACTQYIQSETERLDDYLSSINNGTGLNILSKKGATGYLVGCLLCLITCVGVLFFMYEQRYRALRNVSLSFLLAAIPLSIITALIIMISGESSQDDSSLSTAIYGFSDALGVPATITTSLLFITFFITFFMSRFLKKKLVNGRR